MPEAEGVKPLPPGMQVGPSPRPADVEQLVDEMGVANPTLDISEYIKYLYYKCQKCGKKEFAGGADTATEVDCICSTGSPDPTTKKTPHGKMKLLMYAARRDGQPMTKADFQKAQLQK